MAEPAHTSGPEANYSVIWEPQAGPQTALIACPAFEVFFGGARGGGKTDGMLGEWVSHADMYGANAVGLMIRRELTQLVETIERSRQLYLPLGARFHEQEKMWRFPNGARLRFAYLERDSDAEAYQGHSYTRVYVEEIGNFPSSTPIFKLMATLRSGAGVPCGFRATGNPGGPGHQWVRARYIDPAPLGWRIVTDTFKNPWTSESVQRDRVFIPSKLADNSYLGTDYVANLQMSGNAQLVRAWLEGDWSVIEGAFFPEWSNNKHVIAPFAIPKDWLRFRSGDWGSARPFSIGWWAVVGDDHRTNGSTGATGNGMGAGWPNQMAGPLPEELSGLQFGAREAGSGSVLPRGSLVCYREWYGASAPNVGLKLPAETVADGILERDSKDGEIGYGVLDPSAFASDGGPSIAERMATHSVFFRRADNARVSQRGAMGGWDQLRARLRGDGERPAIYWFSTCLDSVRTIPALQHDIERPEDVDTESDDHCFAAGTLVATPDGSRAIEQLPEYGIVLTVYGPRPYRSARLTRHNAALVRITLSGGASIVCTPDHRFMLASGEWNTAENLKGARLACSPYGSVQPSRNLTGFATIGADIISSAMVSGFMSWCGRKPMANPAKVGTFTTSTATGPTIVSTISNVLRRGNIWLIGTVRNLAHAAGNICRWLAPPLSFGMDQRLAAHGIANTISATSGQNYAGAKQSNVRTAPTPLKANQATDRTIARMPANPQRDAPRVRITKAVSVPSALSRSWQTATPGLRRVRASVATRRALPAELVCLNVEPFGRADVYCLTVQSTGSFLLANGAVVSNCGDQARYACMSRPYIRDVPKPIETKLLSVGPANQVTLDDVVDTQRRYRGPQRI